MTWLPFRTCSTLLSLHIWNFIIQFWFFEPLHTIHLRIILQLPYSYSTMETKLGYSHEHYKDKCIGKKIRSEYTEFWFKKNTNDMEHNNSWKMLCSERTNEMKNIVWLFGFHISSLYPTQYHIHLMCVTNNDTKKHASFFLLLSKNLKTNRF